MAKKNTDIPSATAIIAAAGSSTRMNGNFSKQFILIDEMPILAHTLLKFHEAETINQIIIVAKDEDILTVSDLVREFGITKVKNVIPGGTTRQDSVRRGLDLVENSSIAVIHDGARPFVSVDKINETVYAASRYGAAALGVPVKDTVKVINSDGNISHTPDRNTLRLIQTPQAFRAELIKFAFRQAQESGFIGTDDCSVAEHSNIPVKIIDGEYTNIKITTPEDLPVAEAINDFLHLR